MLDKGGTSVWGQVKDKKSDAHSSGYCQIGNPSYSQRSNGDSRTDEGVREGPSRS